MESSSHNQAQSNRDVSRVEAEIILEDLLEIHKSLHSSGEVFRETFEPLIDKFEGFQKARLGGHIRGISDLLDGDLSELKDTIRRLEIALGTAHSKFPWEDDT